MPFYLVFYRHEDELKTEVFSFQSQLTEFYSAGRFAGCSFVSSIADIPRDLSYFPENTALVIVGEIATPRTTAVEFKPIES